MLDHVEHELVIEQADQVETAETGGAAEGEVPDNDNDNDDDKGDVTKTTFT